MSIRIVSVILVIASFCYMAGSQVGGRIINRFGKRPVTIVSATITGCLTIIYMNISIFWLAAVLRFISGIFVGMLFTSALSLALEQVPNVRGSMMSLNTSATYFGAALGAGIGGFTLLTLNYNWVGLILGSLNFIAAIIFFLFVKDPTRLSDGKKPEILN